MARHSAQIQVMAQAANKAARGLLRDFGEVENLQVSLKGPANFVSAADRRAEEVIHRELARARPDYSFLMEESGAIEGRFAEHRWIVDPLDGTTNFLHGLPHFCISIALEQHGELTAAVILDPLRNELFVADRGGGAFMNDRRMRVSARGDLGHALIGTGLPASLARTAAGARFNRQFAKVAPEVAGIRRLGAAALDLAYIAAGRLDGLFQYGLAPWDSAAGILLVQEAGGFVGRLEGDDDLLADGTLVAGNAAVYPRLRELLHEADRAGG